MPSLNVVALVSGGKDSLFSILHCIGNGHRIVALANLYPEESGIQDLDSFMYQTVGHNVIELVAQALDLPLYRQTISGSAVSTSKTYDPGQHSDEVESMHTLLSTVKSAHPDVNAVSSGAILSDYQRTRVESVAIRLDLAPLSYLWQFPFLPPYQEQQLLLDMAAVGQDSRMIKVASGSLDESMLWTNVADAKTISRLVKSTERFGIIGDGSIIGEGGEYETLTIDGPAPLWKQRIDLDEEGLETWTGGGGTAALTLAGARLTTKASDGMGASALRVPTLFDAVFETIQQSVKNKYSDGIVLPHKQSIASHDISPLEGFSGPFSHLANLTCDAPTAELQTQGIIDNLRDIRNIDSRSINHATILLRSMSDFPIINKVYGSFFATPNPPSRVTIACGSSLPAGVHVSISLHYSTTRHREGLHVQSQSYWAPANIGPYSQAICLSDTTSSESTPRSSLIHIAGQIPLVPATMGMCKPSNLIPFELARNQCLLSAQHLVRIAQIMNVNLLLGAMLFIGRDGSTDPQLYVDVASQIWKKLHEAKAAGSEDSEDEDVDVWDVKHGIAGARDGRSKQTSTYRDTIQRDCMPPFFAAEVQTLPRNAPVEWCSTGWAEKGVSFSVENLHGKGTTWRLKSSGQDGYLVDWIVVRTDEELESLKHEILDRGGLWTIYAAGNVERGMAETLGAMVVPCYRLWDSQGTEVRAVLSCMAVQ
ncbi:Diphthine--ammonia ligase-like protein [Elsinoe fawcettii]|nr:Diphthine--ammonia ligase-like protein [Elsinoe fawcettii]